MINTFGVTVSKVSAKLGYMTIDTDTTPSSADVTEWIDQFAAEVINVFRSVGVDTQELTATSNPTLFAHIQGMLASRVAAEVHASNQEGNTDLAERYMAAFNGFMAGIRQRPSTALGDTAHRISTRSHSRTGGYSKPTAQWRKGQPL
jgi:hypothetical protein